MRLGRAQRIHLDILPHAADVLIKDIRNVDELRHLYNSKVCVCVCVWMCAYEMPQVRDIRCVKLSSI